MSGSIAQRLEGCGLLPLVALLLVLLALPLSSATPSAIVPVCASYSLVSSPTHNVTYSGTYFVNSTTNLTQSIVGVRYLVTGSGTKAYLIEYFELWPPSSSFNNTFYSGAMISVGLPLPITGTYAEFWSSYSQTWNYGGPNGIYEYPSAGGSANSGSYALVPGYCASYSSTQWWYNTQGITASTCLAYTASNGSVSITVQATLIYDPTRTTNQQYGYNNANMYGYKLIAIQGTRTVRVTGHTGVASTAQLALSLANTQGQVQTQVFLFLGTMGGLSVSTSGATSPDGSIYWPGLSPAITGLKYTGSGTTMVEETTNFPVQSWSISNVGCSATPPPSPTLVSGLTAACVNGYWADSGLHFGLTNVVYQLTVLYNASVSVYNASMGAYGSPIIDLRGTRTVWVASTTYTQYVNLLPPGTLTNLNDNIYFPASSTFFFSSRGVAFSLFPTISTAYGNSPYYSINYTNTVVSSVSYPIHNEWPTFQSGRMDVIPSATCYNWADINAAYYSNSDPQDFAFSYTVANATFSLTVSGVLTLELGRQYTSMADYRPMYRVIDIAGTRTPSTGASTTIAGLAPMAPGLFNMLWMPYTDLVVQPGWQPYLDTYGLAYLDTAGLRYSLMASTTGSATVREVDSSPATPLNLLGNLTLCAAGLQCPPVSYPMMLCLQYSTVDTTGVYGGYNTTFEGTVSVASGGIITQLWGQRILTTPSGLTYTQYAQLLPKGSFRGNTNHINFSAPLLDAYGFAYTAYPDLYTFNVGAVQVANPPGMLYSISEDPTGVQAGSDLTVAGGPCGNFDAIQPFYPPPVVSCATLTYSFSYSTTLHVVARMRLQFDSSRAIAAPYSLYPNAGAYNAYGFLVTSANGTRLVSHYPAGTSTTGVINGTIAPCHADVQCNVNLIGLQRGMLYAFRLAYNSSNPDATGTAGGAMGAVTVSHNESTGQYWEPSSLATASAANLTLSNYTLANSSGPAMPGGQMTCLMGVLVDTQGAYGDTVLVGYQLTIAYAPTQPNATTANATAIVGTRTVWTAGVPTIQVVTLLPANAVSNDNTIGLTPNTSAISAAGLAFTVSPNSMTLGQNYLALRWNPVSGQVGESSSSGLVGQLTLLPGTACTGYAATVNAYYPPPNLTVYPFFINFTAGSIVYIVNGSATVDIARLQSTLTGKTGYPITGLSAIMSRYSIATINGQVSWSLMATDVYTTSQPFSSTTNDNMAYLPAAALSNGYVSSPGTALMDGYGWALQNASNAAQLLQMSVSSGVYVFRLNGQAPVNAAFCLSSANIPNACAVPIPRAVFSSSSTSVSSSASSSISSSVVASSSSTAGVYSSSSSSVPPSSSMASSSVTSAPPSSSPFSSSSSSLSQQSSSLSSSLRSSSASSSPTSPSLATSLSSSLLTSQMTPSSSIASSSATSSSTSSGLPSSSASYASSSPSSPATLGSSSSSTLSTSSSTVSTLGFTAPSSSATSESSSLLPSTALSSAAASSTASSSSASSSPTSMQGITSSSSSSTSSFTSSHHSSLAPSSSSTSWSSDSSLHYNSSTTTPTSSPTSSSSSSSENIPSPTSSAPSSSSSSALMPTASSSASGSSEGVWTSSEAASSSTTSSAVSSAAPTASSAMTASPSSISSSASTSSQSSLSSSSSASSAAPSAAAMDVFPSSGVALNTSFAVTVDLTAALLLAYPTSTQPSSSHSFVLSYAPSQSSAESVEADSALWVYPQSTFPSLPSEQLFAVLTSSGEASSSTRLLLPSGVFVLSLYVQPSAAVNGSSVRLQWPWDLHVASLSNDSPAFLCQLSDLTDSLLSITATAAQSPLQTVSLLSAMATEAVSGGVSAQGCEQPAVSVGTTNASAALNASSIGGTLIAKLAAAVSDPALLSGLSVDETLSVGHLLSTTLQTLTSPYTTAINDSVTGIIGSINSSTALLMPQAVYSSTMAVSAALISLLSSSSFSSYFGAGNSSASQNSSAALVGLISGDVAAVLSAVLQSSQPLLSASSTSASLDGSSGSAFRGTACERYNTSAAQVQQLLAATAAAMSNGSTLLSTAAFSAQAWQLSSASAQVDASGALALSLPVDEIEGLSGHQNLSVAAVQVSGQWALCGGGLNNTLQDHDSDSLLALLDRQAISFEQVGVASCAVAASSLSSNVYTIEVTDASGQPVDVHSLSTPVVFQLIASTSPTSDSSAPVCAWYDPELQLWSTFGCTSVLVQPSSSSSQADNSSTSVSVQCSCSHLTDFGILYADKKDEAAFVAAVSGYAGYMVLLVVYALICVVSGYQLSRLLAIRDRQHWLTERLLSKMGKRKRGHGQPSSRNSKGEVQPAYAGAAAVAVRSGNSGGGGGPRSSSGSTASSLVVLEHVLVFSIACLRAACMLVLYDASTYVSYALLSTTSILPLVLNLWVFGFVIFQWLAVYYNAIRGGAAGDADFSSNSLARLRLVFYATMTSITAVIVALSAGICSPSVSASTQQGLAWVGIVLTLVVIGLMAAGLFTVGLALVYSLTRDFTSRHATKLFIVALTFASTLLGQSLVLTHQAVAMDKFYENLNEDNMLYYTLDAIGLQLVLYMFSSSVTSSERQRQHMRGGVVSLHSDSLPSTVRLSSSGDAVHHHMQDKAAAMELPAYSRPSFQRHSSKSSTRVLSQSASNGGGPLSPSQVQLSRWDPSPALRPVRVRPLTIPSSPSSPVLPTSPLSGYLAFSPRQSSSPEVVSPVVAGLGQQPMTATPDPSPLLRRPAALQVSSTSVDSPDDPLSRSPVVSGRRNVTHLAPLSTPSSPANWNGAGWASGGDRSYRALLGNPSRVAPLSPQSRAGGRGSSQ